MSYAFLEKFINIFTSLYLDGKKRQFIDRALSLTYASDPVLHVYATPGQKHLYRFRERFAFYNENGFDHLAINIDSITINGLNACLEYGRHLKSNNKNALTIVFDTEGDDPDTTCRIIRYWTPSP